jgi:protein-S-isoprenylcysteine O-methyltransferase Ste14
MWVVHVLIVEGVLAALIFGGAGRFDLPWVWALLAVHATMLSVGAILMGDELRRERLRPGPGQCDRPWRRGAAVALLVHVVVVGLDARFGWSPDVPASLRAGALVVYVAAFAWSNWAMTVNRFFSSVVRLQTDRGHRVITDGPYRFVRHPGYVGLLVAAVSGGVVMGSWYSLLPLVPCAAFAVFRTAMEDRFLHKALPGYEAYAARVRYRLVPGVW